MIKFASFRNVLRSDYSRNRLHFNLTGKYKLACLLIGYATDINFNNIENNMIPAKITQREFFYGILIED